MDNTKDNPRILSRNGNPVLGQLLADIRQEALQGGRPAFWELLRLLGFVMGYEISSELDVASTTIQTPYGRASHSVPKRDVVIVGILRAAVPFMRGMLDAFQRADLGLLAISRDTDTFDPGTGVLRTDVRLQSLPAIRGRTCILCDTMIAAGNSVIAAVNLLKAQCPRRIVVAGALAAPLGLARIQEGCPDVRLVIAHLDSRLNDDVMIVPGLGDAGDIAFGPKA